jgi:hypothetical protein
MSIERNCQRLENRGTGSAKVILEGEVSSHLNIAWRTVRTGDNAKQCIAGTAAGGVGVPEIWMIEGVERVDLHTEGHPVTDSLRLGE